jgi:replicative DNA helicase
MPTSIVGRRLTATPAVPVQVKAEYDNNVLSLWNLPGAVEENKPVANVLRFSKAAGRALQEFEDWLEPQLAEGEELSHLAGWANKLAGAIARIAGVLHMAGAPDWRRPVSRETVQAAVTIGRDYLLPHAQAAFGVMGADSRVEDARAVWLSVCRKLEDVEDVESAPRRFSRRDLHQMNRRRFKAVEDLDPALRVLTDNNLIRLIPDSGENGRGRKGPEYEVNGAAVAALRNVAPRPQRPQRAQPPAQPDGEVEDVESAPAPSEPQGAVTGVTGDGDEDEAQHPFLIESYGNLLPANNGRLHRLQRLQA